MGQFERHHFVWQRVAPFGEMLAKQEIEQQLSKRIDKSWLVFSSVENFEHNRCVDLFSRPEGSYGFEEFRRDAEDGGEWTPVQYYSAVAYSSPVAALSAAMQSVVWLTGVVVQQTPSLQQYLSQHSK